MENWKRDLVRLGWAAVLLLAATLIVDVLETTKPQSGRYQLHNSGAFLFDPETGDLFRLDRKKGQWSQFQVLPESSAQSSPETQRRPVTVSGRPGQVIDDLGFDWHHDFSENDPWRLDFYTCWEADPDTHEDCLRSRGWRKGDL